MLRDPDDAPENEGAAGWDAGSAQLEGPDAALIDVPDDLDLVTEVADMIAILAAQRLRRVDALRWNALADAARYGGAVAEVVERSVRLELAAALRVTEAAAGRMIALADALVQRYPVVLDALGTARVTESHAQILVDALDAVEPALRAAIVPAALGLAEALPVGSFRRALRSLIERERAVTLTVRHDEALRDRRVVVEAAEDGMAWIHAYLPAVEAHAIHGRVTTIADVLRAAVDETRTLDQLRADVFGDLLIDGDTPSHPTAARGIRATVTVTVPALALLGDDEALSTHGVAVVEGVGPIPIGRARELCGGADGWMRILTHPETGLVLSVGRDRYRPPPALRRLVRWRADRCMAPGCGIPAARCEIDHTIAWEHGGSTSLHNLAPLCKGHHTVKHHGGWTVTQLHDPPGTLEWSSPAGRRYVVHPERHVPVFRDSDSGGAPF